MKSVNQLSELFLRQAQLEEAMRKPGGARVTEERELLAVRQQLAQLPEAALKPAIAAAKAKSDFRVDG